MRDLRTQLENSKDQPSVSEIHLYEQRISRLETEVRVAEEGRQKAVDDLDKQQEAQRKTTSQMEEDVHRNAREVITLYIHLACSL